MASGPKRALRALVLVESGASEPLSGLAGQLDAAARAQLDAALLGRAREWAASVSGSAPVETDFAGLVAAAEGAEALLVLRPALINFGEALAADLRSDLDAGCELIVGPTLNGGWYLLALSPANLELLQAAGDGGPRSAGGLLAASRGSQGLEVGLMRAERDLVTDADLRAAQADPLVDPEIAALIS